MKLKSAVILFIFSMFLLSCKNKPAEVTETETELLQITKAQFVTEKMEFGEPVIMQFPDLVHFTGSIVPSVNGSAQVSLPARGLIQKIYCRPGQEITKGAVMFEVSGNEFIDMQKDFAESAAQLKRLKSEYERQKELNSDNIVAKKDYVSAESNYNIEIARYNTLRIKIELLGLSASEIENGKFYDFFRVKAPVKGFVTSVFANIGQYIEPQQVIAEIIDPATFQAKLSVFDKDINKVAIGQNVVFYLADNRNQKYNAVIKSVGKTIDDATKSIDCYADIQSPEKVNLVDNQYIEGNIVINSDSAYAVPEEAILSAENISYILAYEKEADNNFYVRKIKVLPARKSDGFVELTEKPNSNKILLQGGYNIGIE